MPTLFDSHAEFNEWFSKDIESHAEKKSGLDESNVSVMLASHFRQMVCATNLSAARYRYLQIFKS